MARKEQAPERSVLVTIRSPAAKRPVTLESWRYWEIIGELQWLHVKRETAYSTAKWALRANPGETMMLENEVSITVTEIRREGRAEEESEPAQNPTHPGGR